MLTRRAALTGGSVLVAAAGSGLRPRVMESNDTPNSTTVALPPHACDSHVHVIADPRLFPMWLGRDYTPSAAPVANLHQMLDRLGLERAVIVNPDVYGLDNTATIDAVTQLGPKRGRGIATISGRADPGTLAALKEAGIVGFRLELYPGSTFNVERTKVLLRERLKLAATYEWHLDLATVPNIVAAVRAELARAAAPVALDYFGWASDPMQSGFDAIQSLLRNGNIYVKLAEPYRLSNRGPDYPDLALIARSLVEANPDRILWGSGWPHVAGSKPGATKGAPSPNLPIDDGNMLDLLTRWVPDIKTRQKILVANPARLYGF